jgi:cysteinyl-tRNA synthetase
MPQASSGLGSLFGAVAQGKDMSLRLYNTFSRQKEPLVPIDPKNVRLYACGPTVYDHLHIGNGRMLIVFDLLYRVLRRIHGETHVKYVRNITDVDDKINARAAERGIPIRTLTDEMIEIFHEDAAGLLCLPPNIEPRATEHMQEMITIIEKLIGNGHAYVAEGHVLFDVPSMPAYGQLSKRPLDDMIAGRWILSYGNLPCLRTPVGKAHGGAAGRAGISNARR